MSIKISDIVKQWAVSRPTVMKRIKDEKLIGEKDEAGVWHFEPGNVVACFGEPGKKEVDPVQQVQQVVASANTDDPYTLYSGKTTKTTVEAVIAAKDQTIAVLEKQLEMQGEVLAKAQDALQTRLLQDRNRNKSIWDRLFN